MRIHSANPFGGGYAPFSPAQLKQVVENFNRYQSAGGRVPFVPDPQATYVPPGDVSIGHDEDQAFARALLARTDLPSCGQVKRMWMQGADLFAELDGIPEPVAAMCNGGQFREVSAEIYPNFRTPAGQYIGPVLRRVALLGSTPPRQKGLGGLPPMVYSFAEPSRTSGRAAQQVCVYFSEEPFMDRNAALAALAAAGIPTDGFANLGPEVDPVIIAFATYVQGQNANQPAAVAQFSEIQRAVDAALSRTVLPVVNRLGQTFADVQRKTVEQECLTFAETHKDQLFPYERDAKQDTYIVTRLARMDDKTRAAEMDVIAKRPRGLLKFSEQMGDGGGVRIDTSASAGGGDGTAVPADRKAYLLSLTSGGRNIAARNRK